MIVQGKSFVGLQNIETAAQMNPYIFTFFCMGSSPVVCTLIIDLVK